MKGGENYIQSTGLTTQCKGETEILGRHFINWESKNIVLLRRTEREKSRRPSSYRVVALSL